MPKFHGGYKAPNTRTFGGQRFSLDKLVSYKAEADRTAMHFRSGAYAARVVKLPHSFGYAVYYRVKKP